MDSCVSSSLESPGLKISSHTVHFHHYLQTFQWLHNSLKNWFPNSFSGPRQSVDILCAAEKKPYNGSFDSSCIPLVELHWLKQTKYQVMISGIMILVKIRCMFLYSRITFTALNKKPHIHKLDPLGHICGFCYEECRYMVCSKFMC